MVRSFRVDESINDRNKQIKQHHKLEQEKEAESMWLKKEGMALLRERWEEEKKKNEVSQMKRDVHAKSINSSIS